MPPACAILGAGRGMPQARRNIMGAGVGQGGAPAPLHWHLTRAMQLGTNCKNKPLPPGPMERLLLAAVQQGGPGRGAERPAWPARLLEFATKGRGQRGSPQQGRRLRSLCASHSPCACGLAPCRGGPAAACVAHPLHCRLASRAHVLKPHRHGASALTPPRHRAPVAGPRRPLPPPPSPRCSGPAPYPPP